MSVTQTASTPTLGSCTCQRKIIHLSEKSKQISKACMRTKRSAAQGPPGPAGAAGALTLLVLPAPYCCRVAWASCCYLCCAGPQDCGLGKRLGLRGFA